MKLKFIAIALVLAGVFVACQSSDSDPKSFISKADNELDQMKAFAELSEKMQGTWRSDDDSKSELKIEADHVTSFYDGKETTRERFSWQINCNRACGQEGQDFSNLQCFSLEGSEGSTCYALLKVSNKNIQYSLLGGAGKTLSYSKVSE